MGSYTVFVALTWMVATVLLCTQAAPVTDFFGPPQTIEGDSYVEYPNYDDQHKEQEKVEEMERFHRTYKNGTVEFKMALSNGHVQYQRISSKLVDGDKVQVYEGYISEQYKDGRYGTRYYAADENGYRSSSVIIENDPPKLPAGGPYRSTLPQNIQNELAPPNEDDTQTRSRLSQDIQNELSPPSEDNTQTKQKTLLNDLLQIEKDLEEQQLSNLNLGSYNDSESTIGLTEEKKVVSENKNGEEPSVLQNSNGFQTELPITSDLQTSTELFNNFSEEPELSTSPLPVSGSATAEAESSTEQPINDTDSPIQSIEENVSERSSPPSTSSETSAENDDNVKIPTEEPIDLLNNVDLKTDKSIDEIQETTTGNLLNGEIISTEQSAILNNEVLQNTEVEEEAVGRSMKPLTSSEILAENEEDGKVLIEEPINLVNNLDAKTERPIGGIQEGTTGNLLNSEITSTEQSIILNAEGQSPNIDTISNEEPIDLVNNVDLKTEQPIEEIQETTTAGDLLHADITSTEQSATLSNEDQVPNTGVGEELAGRSLNPLNNSPILAENDEDVKVLNEESIDFVPNVEEVRTEQPIDLTSETTTGTLLDNEVVSTERSPISINEAQEPITGVGQIEEVKIDDETSGVSGYPLEDSESTTLSPIDNIPNISAEEELTKIAAVQPALEIIEEQSAETIASENESKSDLSTGNFTPEIENKSTETVKPSSDQVQNEEQVGAVIEDITLNLEASTENSFDEVTVSKQPDNSNSESSQASSSPIPEITEVKTDGDTSNVAKFPLEDANEVSTDLPLEDSSKTDDEASQEISNESQSNEKDSRGFDLLKVLPLSGNNSTSIVEGSGNDEDKHISDETNEETPNKIDIDTEQPESGEELSISTISPEENNKNDDATTDAISTSEENGLDLQTSSIAHEIDNKNTENKFEVSTELPLDHSTETDDEEVPNESDSSEKDGRSLDLLKVLPLSEKNATNIVEGSGNKEDKHISGDISISSQTNEETTDKIDISTEQPESTEELSSATTISGEDKITDITTEDEVVVSTESNEAGSSEKSTTNITEKDNGLSNEKETTIFEDFLNMF